MKKIIISAAVLCVSVLAVIFGNFNNRIYDLFEVNVEALTMIEEKPSNNEKRWFVHEKDKYTITCTLGGDLRCE